MPSCCSNSDAVCLLDDLPLTSEDPPLLFSNNGAVADPPSSAGPSWAAPSSAGPFVKEDDRGALRLLDQRKLPLEEVYIDVKGSADGWNAIRDMVVRGTPAIAIATALSLAVEVNDHDFTGTPVEAASFVSKKLEYLVSSRPTAVNLSDAATKLQNLSVKNS